MKKNISTILVLLSLFLVACSPEAFTFDNLPILRDQDIFFVDEFSDPKSGWLAEKNDNIILEYSPEGFWIISNNQNTIAWSLPGMNFKDVQAEVSVSKVTGSDNNAFGILCRYKNKDNYYRFSISSDGYYGISKVENGTENTLGNGVMDFSFDILQGFEENRLAVICEGSNLELYVNDNRLMSVQDETFTTGDIGIFTENREGDNLAVLFKNFLVKNP